MVGVRKRGAQKGSTMDVCACICLMHEVDFGGNWQLATGKMACLACIDNQGIGARQASWDWIGWILMPEGVQRQQRLPGSKARLP